MSKPANQERGEFALQLGSERYVMRPSYEAIAAFEEDTGKGLMDLTRLMLAGSASTGQVACIATHCIRDWGRANANTQASGVNARRVQQLIMESDEGLSGAMTVIGAMLAMASTGGLTAQGEVKATTTKTKTKDSPPAVA